MKSFNEFKKKVIEKAIPLDEYPDTYLAKRKRDSLLLKEYNVIFTEIIKLLKDMKWQDVEFVSETGGYEYPKLPLEIRNKIKEAYLKNRNKATSDFKQGNYAFWGTFSGEDINTGNLITMQVDRNQRSHFPNNGIPSALRGTGLGYKFYRALLQKYKHLRSDTAGTVEKDNVWQSIVSPKKDNRGNLTTDDVHAIVGPSYVFAMIKDIPNEEKIRFATNFINSIADKSSLTPRNFAIDDELKAILPDRTLAQVDPRRQAEALEAKKKERFEKYAPFGINAHNWDVGDYIVVKQYLLDINYANLPVRKVVSKVGDRYYAIKVEDIAEYERSGRASDTRETVNKKDWVKSQLQPGQVDPSAGREVNKPRTQKQPEQQPQQQTNNDTDQQTYQQKKLIKNFIRRGFDLYVKMESWVNRGRTNDPIIPYLVRTEGTGRNLRYHIMNARTAQQQTLTREEFNLTELKKFNLTRLERKADVRPGSWVFVVDHRTYFGYLMHVDRITPASNRQPGIYLNTVRGERNLYIGNPSILSLATEATNEWLLHYFNDFLLE